VIAVTGATGELGGRVACRLAARGAAQRLVVRDAATAPALAGADVAEASDYGATDEMRAALEGADTLLLVPGRESQERVRQHTSAVDAAVAAGVERIFYFSFVGASSDATFLLGRHHWATEEHIRASGVRHTLLRMNFYLDFMPFFVRPDGLIAAPAGDGRLAPVARDDLADVAVAVLLGGDHDGRTYDVTGGERFTLAEAAERMARFSGKAIAYREETAEEAFASRAHLAPDWEVEGWVSSYLAIGVGDADVATDAVRALAGHEPLTLEAYLAAHPDALDHVTG
jgi:NAD(P)H dehydrogenase (quinone)